MKSENITTEVAIDKCDSLGANMVMYTRQAQRQRVQIIKDSRQEVTDYIFGKQEENPMETQTDFIDQKEEHSAQRIDELVISVLHSKRKRKINQ